MKHLVYILKSQKDNGMYIGKTKDVKRRLTEHNAGKVKSTQARRPLILAKVFECADEPEARALEKECKKGFRREQLKKEIW